MAILFTIKVKSDVTYTYIHTHLCIHIYTSRIHLNGHLENYMYLESTTKLPNYMQANNNIIVLSTVGSFVKSIEAT